MSLRDRLPHLSAEQLERYERMLASSPPLPCRDASRSTPPVPAPDPLTTVCIHRGDQSGTVALRLCCGQRTARDVAVFDCTLLNCRCVQFGQPAESGVETCSTCADKTQSTG